MQQNGGQETGEQKRSFRKGPGLLIVLMGLGTLMFLAVVAWINWPKQRTQAEPLSAALHSIIERIPGRSDALVYIGLEDIRKSGFWQEVVPDSLKEAQLFEPPPAIGRLMRQSGFQPVRDLDTLMLSFRRKGYRSQNYLAVAWGDFSRHLPERVLRQTAGTPEQIGGTSCYAIDSTLWLCRLDRRKLLLSNDRQLLEEFLTAEAGFLQRDSLSAMMIDKAVWKSHLWFALPSAAWTSSALSSLTSANSEVKELGNLNRIQHLALSARFDDGIAAQSEWVYQTRRAAWFASTFLWGASKAAGISTARNSGEGARMLEHIKIGQNLESVMIEADLPAELFRRKEARP